MSYPCVKLDLWIYAGWLLCTLAEPCVNFCSLSLVPASQVCFLFSILCQRRTKYQGNTPFPLQLLIWKDDLASPESDGES